MNSGLINVYYSLHEGRSSTNRREFLKTAAIVGLGVSIPSPLDSLNDPYEVYAESDLVVATGSNPTKIMRASIVAFGGMKRFISKGDIVVVKPNI